MCWRCSRIRSLLLIFRLDPAIISHEYMHTMGLVDLYDFDYETPGKGTGAWDIMSHPYVGTVLNFEF